MKPHCQTEVTFDYVASLKLRKHLSTDDVINEEDLFKTCGHSVFVICTMDIPLDTRNQIIALHNHSSKSMHEISRDMNLPYSTVKRIIDKFHNTGSIEAERKGRCGRKPKLSPRTRRDIIREVQRDPTISVREIMQNNPEVANISSRVTVNRVLLEADYHSRRPVRKFLLTPSMRKRRLDWAKDMSTKSEEYWNKVRHCYSQLYIS